MKLIRWPNLLMIALVQYLIRFAIIEFLNVPHALNHAYYALGVLCSLALAAAGYIINDLHDLPVDQHNKPDRITIGKGIDEQRAWQWYMGLNLVALLSGYILAQHVAIDNLWFIPIIAAALLYLYAVDLKKRPLIGNLTVSLLTALPVFLVAVFDVLPAAEGHHLGLSKEIFKAISFYALFAFWMNFKRELIKDAEDRSGDAAEGFKTLAVLLPPQAFKALISLLNLITLVALGWFIYSLWPSDRLSAAYLALSVLLPLLYFGLTLWPARQSRDFKQLSTLLKLVMLTGILSMLIFSLSLQLSL